MRFSTSTVAAFLLAGASTVLAETFVVTVGKAGALLYEPSSVTAKAGDIVEFQLYVCYPIVIMITHLQSVDF